ncbi:MAG: DUF4404 family protein [Kiritimatiellae bacterium]|nr:DUF4404 family protein [Kiritimatiellia bacterium]
MITESIKKIEARIHDSKSISGDKQDELLALLDNLKKEINLLPEGNNESVESMTGFMEVSTIEAMRTEQNPQLVSLALEGFSSSSREFESSHPSLTNYVNRICDMLSNLGI